MKNNAAIFLLIIYHILLSCNSIQQNKDIANFEDTIVFLTSDICKYNSLEYNNQFEVDSLVDFTFLKSGNFLNDETKNAIIVNYCKDSTYIVKFYLIEENEVTLKDSIILHETFQRQFAFIIDDYNFDNQNDIFIQTTYTNGYGISYGFLILVDPETKCFRLFEKSLYYGNLKPDKNKKILYSEEWLERRADGGYIIAIVKNRWINNELEAISRIKNYTKI